MKARLFNFTIAGTILFAVLFAFSGSATAAEINVPGDVATIQDAIDDATVGDVILVAPGTYNTGYVTNFPTGSAVRTRVAIWKAVTVRSTGSAADTFIEGAASSEEGGFGDDAIRGVYIASGAVLEGFTVRYGRTRARNNIVTERSAGGIWCESTSALITDCNIVDNHSKSMAGGVYSGNLSGCNITGNSTAWYGGGAQNSIIGSSYIEGNSSEKAGGVYDCTVSNSQITNNEATGVEGDNGHGKGGGAWGGTFDNCRITNNTASQAGENPGIGGGLFNPISVSNSLISGNTAEGGDGGGINGETFTVQDCTITGNTAGGDGGGINRGTLKLCDITNNQAANGGGIANAAATNCLLTGNSATGLGGGVYGSDSVLVNCTIADNTAGGQPNDTVGGTGRNNIIENPDSGSFTYSNFSTPMEGTGNLNIDPLFVDWDNGDFHLRGISPCIDAGDPADPADPHIPPMDSADSGVINMGRYGNTDEAQQALTGYTVTLAIDPGSGGSGRFDPNTCDDDLPCDVNYASGEDAAFTITPTGGNSHISSVTVDSTPGGAVGGYTFENISENHTLTALFQPGTQTPAITASVSTTPGGETGGTITPSGNIPLSYGDDQTFTFSSNQGYTIEDVLVNNGSQGAVTSYTFNDVSTNHAIVGKFIAQRTLSSSSNTGGIVTPIDTQTVNYGESMTYNITPDDTFRISDVKVDGSSMGAISEYTFNNVTIDQAIYGEFERNKFTITPTAGTGGSIDPSIPVEVIIGGSQQFSISPDTGYGIDDVEVNNTSVGSNGTYTFTNVDDNHTISATFTENPADPVITVTAGANGKIEPPAGDVNGNVTVTRGGSQVFTVTPDPNYQIAGVTVDNTLIGTDGTYTFNDVDTDHTFGATFRPGDPVITTRANDGRITAPDGITSNGLRYVEVAYGQDATFTLASGDRSTVLDVLVDTVPQGLLTTYTFPQVTSNHTLELQTSADIDGDGVPDSEEPDGYEDNNQIAAPDSEEGTGTILLDVTHDAALSFSDVDTIANDDDSILQWTKPDNYEFKDGFVSFTINGVTPGGTVTVDITFPSDIPAGAKYYKVVNGTLQEFASVAFNGNKVTLTLTDGGSGDIDGQVNGSIEDPGGVAFPSGSSGATTSGGCFIGSLLD